MIGSAARFSGMGLVEARSGPHTVVVPDLQLRGVRLIPTVGGTGNVAVGLFKFVRTGQELGRGQIHQVDADLLIPVDVNVVGFVPGGGQFLLYGNHFGIFPAGYFLLN